MLLLIIMKGVIFMLKFWWLLWDREMYKIEFDLIFKKKFGFFFFIVCICIKVSLYNIMWLFV